MSTAMWKLEKDLCRCCHAEGSFKNLSEPCFQLGQEEIYSDMLHECLDVKIVPMTGALRDVTFTICESCVARLRDAANFKKQVQDCEERFKDMYSRNLIRGFEVKDEPLLSEPEEMKEELQSMDEDDDDTFLNFDDGDDDQASDASAAADVGRKTRHKGKAKSKQKAKAKQDKKTKAKKTIKEDDTDLTEAAVSGEKKKGTKPKTELAQFCTQTRNEDGSLKFTCNICDRSYRLWGQFLQHYNQVHLKLRKKTHPCVICHQQLVPRHRSKHMEEKHGWPAPTCGACGKKFSYPHQVTKHQKIFHMGERNHKCGQCDMAFCTPKGLKQHEYRHSDARDFSCDYCSKAFKTLKYLRLHTKIHLNDKRYVCSVCHDAFVQSTSLKYHMRKRHPEFL